MSAQGLAVSQSLDRSLNMLLADSRTLFAAARAGYNLDGRGSLVTMFANVEALESDRMNMWHYVSRDVLSRMDYSQVLNLVDMYNPDTHFVALATVNIRGTSWQVQCDHAV